MPRTARRWSPGSIFHVDVRAHGGEPILAADADRAFVVGRCARVLREEGIRCLGWSVLSNHFHLLLQCPSSPGHAMQRLNTAIAGRIRRTQGGAGSVFQGRFYSGICGDEASVLRRLAYVTANALRHRVVPTIDALRSHPWSSLAEVMGDREPLLVDPAAVLAVIDPGGATVRARGRLVAWIADRARVWDGGAGAPDEDAEPTDVRLPRRVRDEICTAATVGSATYGVAASVVRRDDLAAVRQLLRARGWGPDSLVRAACAAFGVRTARVRTARRTVAVVRMRAAVSHVACDVLGWPGVEVALALGLSGSAVSRARRHGPEALESAGLSARALIAESGAEVPTQLA